MEPLKQTSNARKFAVKLSEGEDAFLPLTDKFLEFLINNEDAFQPRDIYTMCARMDNVYAAMIAAIQNGNGLYDPEDLIQARETLAEYRDSVESML